MLAALSLALAVTSPVATCPDAADLPLLTIDAMRDSAVPLFDDWQVFWSGVPLSDAQVAVLGGDDTMIDRTRAEMEARGTWVFGGMGIAALGAAASSIGWILYGQNDQPQGVTLPLAAGGLVVGVVGVLVAADAIQRPLEPHLAPTPTHRLSRAEARSLVVSINQRLRAQMCGEPAAALNAPSP